MSIVEKTNRNIEYWRERKINWADHYWNLGHKHREMLIEILKACQFSKVCEIGCACGANLYKIKKVFPWVSISGCDLSEDAIKTARRIDTKADFRVGSATDIPFKDKSFDLVITDACLIYIDCKNISRVISEIRRIGSGGKVLFVEFHSENWLKRMGLLFSRYTAYNYIKILNKHNFKNIKTVKITKDKWPSKIWSLYGYIITADI